jgi:dethiobiotin synthase
VIPGIFIAGAGTDVGKTVVTAGVLRLLLRHGSAAAPAMVMKPVQTGCSADDAGRLRAPDVEFVLRAAGIDVDEETRAHLAPYCFEPACSPYLAARMAGQRIEMEEILAGARWLAARYRRLVVEGAGGVLVPLNESEIMLSIAWEMRMPVLLVGQSGLGTINQVLLSLEAIRRRGCEVLGVVLSDTQPVAERDSYIHQDNVSAVASLGQVAVARIPYLGAPPGLERLDASLEQCEFLREYRV